MKPRDVIYCQAPWDHSPARAPEPHGLEPHCDRCPARLSRYRAHGETRCAPCTLATRIDPTPNPCGCGCGEDVWPDYKGRGGIYAPDHRPPSKRSLQRMARELESLATLDEKKKEAA